MRQSHPMPRCFASLSMTTAEVGFVTHDPVFSYHDSPSVVLNDHDLVDLYAGNRHSDRAVCILERQRNPGGLQRYLRGPGGLANRQGQRPHRCDLIDHRRALVRPEVLIRLTVNLWPCRPTTTSTSDVPFTSTIGFGSSFANSFRNRRITHLASARTLTEREGGRSDLPRPARGPCGGRCRPSAMRTSPKGLHPAPISLAASVRRSRFLAAIDQTAILARHSAAITATSSWVANNAAEPGPIRSSCRRPRHMRASRL